MTLIDVGLWGAGIANWLPIAWCLAAVGIVTFLGTLFLAQTWKERKTDQLTAVTPPVAVPPKGEQGQAGGRGDSSGTPPAPASDGFDKFVVQMAITASVLVVYFALAPVLVFGGVTLGDPALSNAIIGHFTTVVEVVVAFYMGSTALGYTAKIWGVTKAPPDQQAGLLRGM